MDKRIQQLGFTLVELMITIAIVGVLAAISIPSYKAYLRKSRQTEVKVLLGNAYIAENAHFNSGPLRSYSGCLGVLGFSPEGQNYYAMGFTTSVFWNTCNPNGVPTTSGKSSCLAYSFTADAAGNVSVLSQCDYVEGQIYFLAKKSEPGPAPATQDMLGQTLSWNTFEIPAWGAIGGSFLDYWEVNQNKEISNHSDGIMDYKSVPGKSGH